MLKSERHQQILKQLNANGSVRVSELARTLNVDAVTIRRDLAWLEQRGRLHRVHGGAILSTGERFENLPVDPGLEVRRRIAEAAARFIANDSAVFLGPGALTPEIIPFLNAHTNLTIVTNALPVAWQTAQQKRHTLHVIGGQVAPDYGIYGDIETLNRTGADMIILEATGLDAERGLTHDHRENAEMARALFALRSQVVVLITPERLGRVGAVFIAPAGEVDVLITGREARTPPLWDLSELGIRVILT